MARQRRDGRFRPPELRGTLGTLLRTTLAQANTLRDALERGAREGRSRLDAALATSRQSRERQDALADLGQIVLDLIRDGEIDLAELPEAREIVAHLDELDASHDDNDDESAAAPLARNRRPRPDNDDGTVSANTWAPPNRAKRPAAPVWRPPVDDEADTTPPRARQTKVTARERPKRPDDEITARERPSPSSSARKGGISFEEDDDDLAEFMHPDDVPPKGSPESDS